MSFSFYPLVTNTITDMSYDLELYLQSSILLGTKCITIHILIILQAETLLLLLSLLLSVQF